MAQGGARCELCQLERYTRWYAEFHHPFPFVILDCDSCDVPMAVLREHRAFATPRETAYMEEALALVAAHAKSFRKWVFDHRMRQIPEHYHFHARPLPC